MTQSKNLGTTWANPCGKHNVSAHMDITWEQPGQTHMGNTGNLCTCRCPYGNNLGKPMWETYINVHMDFIWEQHGLTHVGNIYKCPYGFHMGRTWVDPCGKHNYVSAHMDNTWEY